MRIAITADRENPEALLLERFSRCRYFHIYEDDATTPTKVLELPENEESLTGVDAAKALVEENVDVVITGRIRHLAWKELDDAGVDVFISEDGGVDIILDEYRRDELLQVTHSRKLKEWKEKLEHRKEERKEERAERKEEWKEKREQKKEE